MEKAKCFFYQELVTKDSGGIVICVMGCLILTKLKNSPTEKYGSRIRKVPTLFAVEFDSEGLVEASPIFSSARSIKKTGTLKDTFEHGARTEYYAALHFFSAKKIIK